MTSCAPLHNMQHMRVKHVPLLRIIRPPLEMHSTFKCVSRTFLLQVTHFCCKSHLDN
jgi:hypothetical protein